MAKILIIVDRPVKRTINTMASAIVQTNNAQVDIMYVGSNDIRDSLVNKLRGKRADIVLVPQELTEVPKIYKPLMDSLMPVVEGQSSKIIHYENSY